MKFRQAAPQSWVIDPTEPSPLTPQYGTLMKRLDETYNFPNIMHFEICKIKLLEVKNYFQALQTVSAHAIVATAKHGLGGRHPTAILSRVSPA